MMPGDVVIFRTLTSWGSDTWSSLQLLASVGRGKKMAFICVFFFPCGQRVMLEERVGWTLIRGALVITRISVVLIL